MKKKPDDVFTNSVALLKCNMEKCKKEQDMYNKRQQKHIQDITKLMQNIKLNQKVRMQRLKKLTIESIKCLENRKLIDCELQNCYIEFEKYIKSRIATTLASENPSQIDKDNAELYSKALKKGKITTNDVLESQMIQMKYNMEAAAKVAQPMFNKIAEGTSCIEKHCLPLKKKVEAEKKKYLLEVQKVLKNTKLSKEAQDAKMEELAQKFYRNQANSQLIDCQLANCRKETEDMLKEALKIMESVKDPKIGNVIKAYNDMLQKNNMTKEKLVDLNLQLMKTQGYKHMK